MAATISRRLVVTGLSLAGIGSVLVLTLLAGWAWLSAEMAKPQALAEPVVIEIPRGAGVRGIAERLAEVDGVPHPLLFELYVRVTGRDRQLKAGEYEIPAHASALEIIDLLEDGKARQFRVTVAEGLTVVEIFDLLAAEDVLTGDLPERPSEGSLLPDTYFVNRGTPRAVVVERMQTAMSEAVAEFWAERPDDTPLQSAEEMVTLASIVEKETGVAAERPLVAGVFLNRMNIGMKLQSDPTTIYALTKGQEPLGRALLRKDWDVADPYNTYYAEGLPPGPIANPGREALEAVVRPEASDYLYFVADGTGGHAFAKSLNEHNRNVQAWRRHQRQQNQGG